MGGRGARLRKSSSNQLNSIVPGSDDGINGPQYHIEPLPIDLEEYSLLRKDKMDEKLAKSVISIEDQIRYLEREHVSIINEEGIVINEHTGGPYSVKFPETPKIPGLSVVHNHPRGGTFSIKDLDINARYQFKHLSISTAKATYILNYTGESETIRFNALRLSMDYNSFFTNLTNSYSPENGINSLKTKCHNWLQQNAHFYGYEYVVEEEDD